MTMYADLRNPLESGTHSHAVFKFTVHKPALKPYQELAGKKISSNLLQHVENIGIIILV